MATAITNVPTRPAPADEDPNSLRGRIRAMLRGPTTTETGIEVPPLAGKEMGRLVGCSHSAISSWLNHKYPADPTQLEVKLSDFLARAANPVLSPFANGKGAAAELFTNNIIRRIFGTFDLAVQHNALVGIVSEPGMGKTSACRMYIKEHPSFQLIELNRAMGGGSPTGIMDAMCDQTSVRVKRTLRRGPELCRHFAAGDRLIIIDNAEILTRGGLDWVLGFYDVTRSPMALLGNDELLTTLQLLNRAPSRVTPLVKLDFDKSSSERARQNTFIKECTTQHLKRHWPEAQEDAEVIQLCSTILSNNGRMRALSKLIAVAQDWWAKAPADAPEKDPAEALRMAMAKHAIDYKLSV